jgi:hypothetical protein
MIPNASWKPNRLHHNATRPDPSPTRKGGVSTISPEFTLPLPSCLLSFALFLDFIPDVPQTSILHHNPHQLVLCCSRQWGKSTITALKALYTALSKPASLTLLIAPVERQSAELLGKVTAFLPNLGIPPRSDGRNPYSLLLPNQSRIVALPGNPNTTRGFSAASLIVFDEAAFIPNDVYHALLPTLAVSNGDCWVISTPNGPDGFFHTLVTMPPSGTRREIIPAPQCPRISREFLKRQRLELGETVFKREYLCEFITPEGAFLDSALIERIFKP